MSKLNPCPMCGSHAKMDSTGTLECYGWDWQTITVECTDSNHRNCNMSISMQADFHYTLDAWDKLEELWNSFKPIK